MYQGRFESKTVAARNMSRRQQMENAPTSQQCAPIPQLNEHDEELQQLLVEQPPVQPPVQPVYAEPVQLEPTQPIPARPAPVEEPEFLLPVQPAPVPAPAEEEATEPRQKRGPRAHTVVFYTLYFLFIAAFFVGLYFVMGELDGFLVKYEAAQPDARSQEVFAQYFSQPDWAQLYDVAGISGTQYDGKDAFVSYMQTKVGTEQLTFVETSMGLSKDKKYYVRLGEENIGSFSLGNVAGAVAIPEWDLCGMEFYISYDRDVTVDSYPGYTVKVNGVALDDSHIIRTTTTRAEEYLPDGLHGMRTVRYYLDGLLVAPAVTVVNETGEEVTLSYDAERNAYTHETSFNSITDEQKKAFEKATEIYGRFMITDVNKATLGKYFVGKSYDAITQAELTFIQTYTDFAFTPAKITEFFSYSDTYCSARISRTLNVTRKNGTVKSFDINTTYFMEKQEGGWMVVDITNTDVQTGSAQVRLRFMQDGKLVESQMLDSNSQVIIPPEVTVPNGKQIKGWFLQTTNEDGTKAMTLAFQTNDYGEVFLPAGYELEPMTVHVLFENKGAE